MPVITAAERQTLEILADPRRTENVRRGHLEKFSRLELIEPCPEGVCMTLAGKRILGGKA